MWYEIFKFELKYRAKRWDTYIYFTVLFLYALIAVDFLFGQNLAEVKINAPYLIALTMGVVSALFMMMVSMIMGVAALRDFDYNMESLMFVNPIKKLDYLLGRFLGSFLILLFIFSGLFFGVILADFMPWRDAENLLPFDLWRYGQPFFFIVLPNLFFGSALFFIGGALSRKLLVVYTQGIILLTLYILSLQLTQNSAYQSLAALLDPFCYQSIKITVKYWTTAERNAQMIPLENILIYNRLLWTIIGVVILIIGYYGFSFNVVRDGLIKQKTKIAEKGITPIITKIPTFTIGEGIKNKLFQLQYHSLFYVKSIVKETPFWAIVICGMAIIFINSISLGTSYGVDTYPLTFIVMEDLQEMSVFFFLIILIFYSGELIWKERDAKLSDIYDVLPIAESINLTSKLIGLSLIYIVLMVALIISGVIFQTINGYYYYELNVYCIGFFVEILPSLVLLTMISFFFQVLANHKFIGHLLVVTFLFMVLIGNQLLDINHGLISFGAGDLGTHSAMNGYGHYWLPYFWFQTYWLAFAALIFLVAILLAVRGRETSLKKRWELSKFSRTNTMVKMSALVAGVFIFSGCYIFYNTNILNGYTSSEKAKRYRANYEKELKKFEYLPQPKIVDVNLSVELYPYERNYTAEGTFILTNTDSIAIPKIYVQKIPQDGINLEAVNFSKEIKVDNTYQKFGYYTYTLTEPLQSGDSLKMEFRQTYSTKGFTENVDKRIVYNGTFFDNFQLPTLGYNQHIELSDEDDRIELGLSPKAEAAEGNNPRANKESRKGDDSKAINFEIIIGTAGDQIAVAPGHLEKEWKEGNRNYFHYKSTEVMINFYPMTSARYEILQDKWMPQKEGLGQPINLEIYYHKGHEYNLVRMMQSMKKSFDYFTQEFGTYPYQQMRIVETPRYLNRAQSFPSMVTYSESMGFIMNIDEAEDVDMPFFITAHELAHQWWGLQVAAANVQGRKMILESLAQYSALMVLKKHYPEEKVQQLLEMERNRYLEGGGKGSLQEMPLATEDHQNHVYYGKGTLNLYALQDYISEDSVNLALKRFVKDWNSFDGQKTTQRYATTIDLLTYFKAVTPDSLQYLITDLFEKVVLFENSTNVGTYEKVASNKYKIELPVSVTKYELDSLGEKKMLPINDWVEIGVYGEKEKEMELIYLKKHKITNRETVITILVNEKPGKAGIDPLYKLIEQNTADNVKVLLERNW